MVGFLFAAAINQSKMMTRRRSESALDNGEYFGGYDQSSPRKSTP